MTPSQASSLRRVTNTLQDMATNEGGLAFTLERGSPSLVLIASNAETSAWYQRSIGVGLRIGPRGGIKIYAACGISERDILSRII